MKHPEEKLSLSCRVDGIRDLGISSEDSLGPEAGGVGGGGVEGQLGGTPMKGSRQREETAETAKQRLTAAEGEAFERRMESLRGRSEGWAGVAQNRERATESDRDVGREAKTDK